MVNRRQFHWLAQLQSADGKVIEYPIVSYWDPEHQSANETPMAERIANCAQAQAYVESGKTRKYQALSAVLQD
jgi:hypothetical protein